MTVPCNVECGTPVLPALSAVRWWLTRPAPHPRPSAPSPASVCSLAQGLPGWVSEYKDLARGSYCLCRRTDRTNAHADRTWRGGPPRPPPWRFCVYFSLGKGLRTLWGRRGFFSVSDPAFSESTSTWFDCRPFFHATCLQKCYFSSLRCPGKARPPGKLLHAFQNPALVSRFIKFPLVHPELCGHTGFKTD